MEIHNLNGQLIKVLCNTKQLPNKYNIQWNGEDDKGNVVSPGIYFYKIDIQAEDKFFTETKCMSIIR